jgi:hypothetical protein
VVHRSALRKHVRGGCLPKKPGDRARIKEMNPTVLADPTVAPESEQPSETSANGAGSGDASASTPTPTPGPARACANCGAALNDGQDWCLQCGAAAQGSLDGTGPGWRSATLVLGVTAALVLGAAAAAYAALTQPGSHTIQPKVITIAQAPVITTPTTPSVTTTPTPSTTATTPGALGTPTTIKPLPTTPSGRGAPSAPPKIPLTASTPKSSGTTGTNTTGTTGTGKTNTGSSESGTGTTKSGSEAGGESNNEPTPILLDTNAASTYNPYNLPAINFGDPSLAIDGETSTAWTAQVEPSTAPKMAVGLALDLKTPQRVGSLTLITSTPGMTVQVYGANVGTLPTSITDPAWVTLSPSLDAKKRKTHLKLRDSSKAFRYITLWISGAPASAVGTPSDQAPPTHVSVNELELFPAK